MLERRVDAASGAEILCFAEYAWFELAALVPDRDPMVQVELLQRHLAPTRSAICEMASSKGVTIVSPGFVELTDRGPTKRTWVCSPDRLQIQDKVHLTAWEKEHGFVHGTTTAVFDHDGIRFGVAICYDVEFPNQIRGLTSAGAEMILVPSCTDTLAAFTRVNLASRARALENQIPVGVAPLTGGHASSEFVSENHGVAGLFVPPDVGLPDDGVVASGDGDGWLLVDVDLPAVAGARDSGHVSVRKDWTVPYDTLG
jgi:predicted amidohydrolase